MNIKRLVFFLIFSIGFALGVYFFITIGSYFLLVFASFFGLLLGYLFGNLAKQSIELKKIDSKTKNEIKRS